MSRRVVIHGHFYQPPREEPWLDLVPRERSAAPDHDWNARITRECYAPLALGRMLDPARRIRRVINCYAWCSFDVWPTLWRWLDRHAPDVRDAVLQADAASIARLGHGNAIACPYHHVILPLASRRDKITEVRWGIRHFRQWFRREPVGMWLPETAVDEETLEILAAEGIRFTILAPHQVETVPAWGRPGRWRSVGGKELALFVHDGTLAHGVAFGDLLENGDRWAERMLAGPNAPDGVTVTSLATDGETFGHHHRFGDLALAEAIGHLEHAEGVQVTNFAALLAESPPTETITVHPDTSWSCAHGIERWRSNCGCRMDPETQQTWRAPLREGLNALAQAIHEVVERDWPRNADDPWQARDLVDPDGNGSQSLPAVARELLEAERHALAMFTSCAWFFDDLDRLEPRIVLRHAARALEFLPSADRTRHASALVQVLAEARGNDPAAGTGADLWNTRILPGAEGPAHLAAGLSAVRALAPDLLDRSVLPGHTWRCEGDVLITRHLRTGRERRWLGEPMISGVVAERVIVTSPETAERYDIGMADYPEPIRDLLRTVAAPMVFDALLDAPNRAALRDGVLTPEDAERLAFEGAWHLIARDGLEEAGVLLHAVLDLLALEDAPLTDRMRAQAFTRLAGMPPSPARQALADRLGLAMPEPA